MSVKVTWRGEDVKREVRAAAVVAVRQTADAAAARARASHPGWKTQTGETEASIDASDVTRTARGAHAGVGSRLPHFLFLEVGFRGRSGDHTLRRAGDVEGGRFAKRFKAGIK